MLESRTHGKTHKDGVTMTGKKLLITQDLPKVVGLNQSCLNSPLFVISEDFAEKTASITVFFRDSSTKEIYGSFTLARQSGYKQTPLPTIYHAFWLDILMAQFSANWNEDGDLFFETPSVLAMSDCKANSSARDSLFESILRYSHCPCNWDKSFGKRRKEVNGPIIIEQDIWLDDAESKNIKKANIQAGRLKKEHAIHKIKFHPEIVKSLDPRLKPEVRLINTSIFKNKNLKKKKNAYAVYRFYAGHNDKGMIWKSVFDPQIGLISIFSWNRHKSEFLSWFLDILQYLKDINLIEHYEIDEKTRWIGVKMPNQVKTNNMTSLLSESENPHNLALTRDNRIIDIEFETSKKLGIKDRKGKSRKPKERKISSIPDDMVLVEYHARCKSGFVDEKYKSIIDELIIMSPKIAIDMIRKHVLTPN